MNWMMNRSYKKVVASFMIFALLFSMLPAMVSAEPEVGETVVTLGEDLSQSDQEQLLDEMGVSDDVRIIYIANEDEHHYLGDYIDSSLIGTNAISSTRITIEEEGHGIEVESNNIDWVTDEMYANSLATAGVQDADVYVTAPFEVSGTAGLLGIVEAFEEAADVEIDEEQKQVANEEMVTTAELADEIGSEEAAELIARLKDQLEDRDLETEDDYRQLILDVADELGVSLNEDDIDALVHLLQRLEGLDIDWNQVSDQLQDIRDNLNDILQSEETQNLIQRALDFLVSLVDRISDLFS